jgi:hypothetical protein
MNVMTRPANTATRQIRPVNLSDMSERDHVHRVWVITALTGTEKSDLLDPALWIHAAYNLREGDHVEVRAQDGTWHAEMIVRNVDRGAVKVGFLNYVDFNEHGAEDGDIGDRDVRWCNAKSKFGVFRKDDGALVRDGFVTANDAKAWAIANPE